ncbi:hypothetical protein DFP72DRAFT_218427 [Ephemerocybe angulata]|uniref:Uncharacterized protein n=1 Tax=Ephemerocybe angulata TaxID=980116 RepID=A0A8H6H7T6_9AGAR|nr:hypothetical protein DFP72DRAFT_218427 [Tulosesus angulatus]
MYNLSYLYPTLRLGSLAISADTHSPLQAMPRRLCKEGLDIIVPDVDEIPMTVSQAAQAPPPVIGDIHPVTGKKSVPKVFAIPVHSEQQMRFIEGHYPEWRSLSGSEKMWEFRRNIAQFLPSDWYPELAWIIVPVQKKVWQTLAIVICGNRSEDEMAKANDERNLSQRYRTPSVSGPLQVGTSLWTPMPRILLLPCLSGNYLAP